jgi:hypothetical protein
MFDIPNLLPLKFRGYRYYENGKTDLSKANGETHTVYGWDESEPATHKCMNHFAIAHALGLEV